MPLFLRAYEVFTRLPSRSEAMEDRDRLNASMSSLGLILA